VSQEKDRTCLLKLKYAVEVPKTVKKKKKKKIVCVL